MPQIVAQGYDGLSHHRVTKLDDGRYVTEYSLDKETWSEGEPHERVAKRNAEIAPVAAPSGVATHQSRAPIISINIPPLPSQWLGYLKVGAIMVVIVVAGILIYYALTHLGVH